MSAVLNDRDAILQAATVRIVNPKNAWINLTASAPGFHLNAAGQVDLAKVTVTADLVGLDDAVTFTAAGGTLSNAVGRSVDVTYNGQTAILTATVVSNGDEFKRSLIIPVLRDGASGTGTPGARGAGHYYASGTAWTDALANITVPTTKVIGDVVTISSGTFVMEKRWTGSAWVETGTVLNGRLIVDQSILTAALSAGAITAEKLAVGAVTARSLAVMGDANNLIPDPRFKDLAWWNLLGQEVSATDWTDSNQVTGWKQNASLKLLPNGYVLEDAWTGSMPIVPGATYLIEYRVEFSSDWYGELTIDWHWPLVAFYQNGVPSSGYTWPDGGPIQYASNARGVYTVAHVVTIPNDPRLVNSNLRSRRRVQNGSVEIGGFSITRVMDSVLIKDGAVTAQKISVTELAAIVAFLGKLQIGPAGHIRQGMSAFNTGKGFWLGDDNGTAKLALGDPGGAGITWDGVSLTVNKADFGTFTAVLSSGGMTSSGPNGTRVMGSRQMTGSGGKLPYRSFSWTITDIEGNAAARTFISGESTDTVSVTASGTNATTRVRITGTIIDANGLAASASFISTASFGAV